MTLRRYSDLRSTLHPSQLGPWIINWFWISSILCLYDAAFVYFRPHTLPGGSLAKYFSIYTYYTNVDQRYKDTDDSFSMTTSICNFVEIFLNLLVVYLNYKKSLHTKPLAFTVSVMSFWKTVIYMLMFYELAGGKDYRKGNTFLQEFFVVVLPTGVWIVIPFLCIASLWQDYLYDYSKKR